MSLAPARPRGASLRTLIVGGAAALVLSTCIMLGGLLLLVARMRASIDREASVLFAEQQSATAIGREVERQLLEAAAYLHAPGPRLLARFRERGQRVYDLERGYLFRDLSLRERLQAERVKELHQTLEVLAQAAFDARDAHGAEEHAHAEALFAASAPVQEALDRLLAMREESYQRERAHQAAVLQRLYVAAALTAVLLLLAILGAVRFVNQRILTPIGALSHAAERVGSGDLAVRVPHRADDELTRLGSSFNAMTAGLERLQRELRESEERYRRVVELSPDAIVVHDESGIRLGNPEAARLFGAPSTAALIGTPLRELLHPDAMPAAPEQLASALASGVRIEPVELTFRRLDGALVHGELVAAPFDDEGQAASLVAVRDVTARREAESALRETEERLRQAQKMETVGRLAGGIAHDFNNLLTIILSHCELLLAGLHPTDPHRGDVEEVRAAGARAAALTRQLLAFSRKQVLQLGSVDLNEVVREMAVWLRRLIPSDIDLRVELAPGLASVEADRGQIEQVILNLVLNARDAMSSGGALMIRTARLDLPASPRSADGIPAGAYVSLSVIDNGVGMDAATRARIFEPFFTTKEVGRGTGLGLATVLGIVQQSGGHIRVESEPDRGSHFEILLPAQPAGAPRQAPTAAATPESTDGHETVLLAEDDNAVRALARRVLTSRGYTVIDARDGSAAERAAAAYDGTIDLLVTDVVMPGIGGRELARRLAHSRPAMKVLFTSGYTEDEILRRGVAGQTLQMLEKPYSTQALLARVRATLDGTG
jgi:PAS domain S-box-containing protein